MELRQLAMAERRPILPAPSLFLDRRPRCTVLHALQVTAARDDLRGDVLLDIDTRKLSV